MGPSAKKRIVVTGHLGFIASAFCWNFRDRYEINGIDFAGWGSMLENLAPGVHDYRADLADLERVHALLDEIEPEAIINFAAESHVDRAIENDVSFWTSNVLGTRSLALEANKRRIRMVQVSTDEVYGDALNDALPWVETSPVEPRNPYSVTKAAAEMLLLSYTKTLDLDVVITRGANTIGPRQFPEKAVPKAIGCFLSGRAFPLFKTPARRMWMHVNDHVSGVEAALRLGKKDEVYNLAPSYSCERYTHEVIEHVREIIGKGDIKETEDRKAYDLRYLMDASKARNELAWKPEHDFESTLEDTVQWYLENQNWLQSASDKCSRGAGP